MSPTTSKISNHISVVVAIGKYYLLSSDLLLNAFIICRSLESARKYDLPVAQGIF